MSAEPPVYEQIGRSYAVTRREDPSVAADIHACLGAGAMIVNVGAGTGNYEPTDRLVVAVEPSPAMLGQRNDRSPHVVRGVAERLPFPDGSFDTAMALLTMHHWAHPRAGLQELRRVAARQVVFFFEPLHTHQFWGLDYFPEALQLPSEHDAPGEALLRDALHVQEIRRVLIAHDCVDGFGAAFWARPEAYLDPVVQAGMSWLALLPDDARQRGSARLAEDLESGVWDERFGHLRGHTHYDAGLRIAIAE